MASRLGRFLEISIRTQDIRESVQFYEQLGFSHCVAGDTWPHPYGVLTDGRIVVGLHQYRFPSPSITWVREGIAGHIPEYTALGIELAFAKTGDDCFNEIGFRDPGGQMNAVLEARTYSPSDRAATETSLCGEFEAFSVPSRDFDASLRFWENLGFVGLETLETPYVHQPLTSDTLNLALHRPRTFEGAMLVFTAPDMPRRLATLREKGLAFAEDLPAGLDPRSNALLTSPEGMPLLLVEET